MKKRTGTGRSSKKGYLKPILGILFADLILLLFLKYKFNDLGFRDFSFTALGNILNIGFTFITAVGIWATERVKKITPHFSPKPAMVLLIISAVIHLFILFTEYFRMDVPGFLSGIASSKRIYYMYLFILSQIIQFYVLSLIISSFFAESKFVYLKAVFKAGFIAVIVILFSFFYSVLKKHDSEQIPKGVYKTGVILGAAVWQGNKPSPIFEGRIKKAFALYKEGIIKKIQVTGSNAPGEKSEAKTALDYLKRLGMNQEDILIEEKSSNTVEQVAFLKTHRLKDLNLQKVIVISDEFHLVRALEICRFFDINAESSASEYNITTEKLLYYRLRESAALLLFWLFAV